MVYLPFSSVYIREDGVYAVQVPRDAQYVLEDDDFAKLDSRVGDLAASIDDFPLGRHTTAYLCPHQGVAKGWPPCQTRKEPEDVTEALRTTARFLGKHIRSPYAECLKLPPPCKIV